MNIDYCEMRMEQLCQGMSQTLSMLREAKLVTKNLPVAKPPRRKKWDQNMHREYMRKRRADLVKNGFTQEGKPRQRVWTKLEGMTPEQKQERRKLIQRICMRDKRARERRLLEQQMQQTKTV